MEGPPPQLAQLLTDALENQQNYFLLNIRAKRTTFHYETPWNLNMSGGAIILHRWVKPPPPLRKICSRYPGKPKRANSAGKVVYKGALQHGVAATAKTSLRGMTGSLSGASLARISHRPSSLESKAAPESVWHRPSSAIVSRMGITALNSLLNRPQTAGKFFSFGPEPIASAAPHGLWRGLRLQVLLEVGGLGLAA